jgi:fructose/tagatose bisphosphate aldolase
MLCKINVLTKSQQAFTESITAYTNAAFWYIMNGNEMLLTCVLHFDKKEYYLNVLLSSFNFVHVPWQCICV